MPQNGMWSDYLPATPPPGAMPMPQGGMPPMDQGPPPDQGPAKPSDILQQIIDLSSQYVQVEPVASNKLIVQKLMTMAQQVLANEESDAQGLMQGKVTPRALLTHG